MEERGDAAVIHGLRGQPSNRKLAAALEQKILARVRQRYADFGPTLASEHLAKDELLVSRETLRKWMAKEALWRPRRQRVKTVQEWRERRASFGELVMQDSSLFCWFEERGPACQLIAMIDDATSRVWARFVEHDSREENRRGRGPGGRRSHRQLEGHRWGVPREEVCAGLRGARVEIERRLDGSHGLRFRGRYLRLRPCPEPAPRAGSPLSRTYKNAPSSHPWRTFQYGRNPNISTLR